jgi:hypothetical protein
MVVVVLNKRTDAVSDYAGFLIMLHELHVGFSYLASI